MPLYFAYGSNMDVTAMAARCPASKPLGLARLARHRLIINADGYATVVRDPKTDVHGLLFDLAFSDIPALDRYEGVGRGLYSKLIQPVLTAQGPRKAMVYIGRSAVTGKPQPGYLEGVIAAAEAAGLAARYIAGLRALAGQPAPGPEKTAAFRAIGNKAR